jgi:ABC-type lipoprotein export system ATPase subunit
VCLELTGVSFRYPGVSRDVFTDVNLTVARGESVAVVAPSGRGKSTLLGVAGLLLEPREGSVRIDGQVRRLRDAPSLLGGDIAWVLQSANLLPRRTVLDNTALPSLAAGQTRRSAMARASALLAEVGIDPEDDRQARTLSGGEAQRVGVARALMSDPAVLLVDEPTANLDAVTAAVVSQALFHAASGRVALVIATHDDAVARGADRVFRLDDPAA